MNNINRALMRCLIWRASRTHNKRPDWFRVTWRLIRSANTETIPYGGSKWIIQAGPGRLIKTRSPRDTRKSGFYSFHSPPPPLATCPKNGSSGLWLNIHAPLVPRSAIIPTSLCRSEGPRNLIQLGKILTLLHTHDILRTLRLIKEIKF